MCGRYSITTPPEAMAQLFGTVGPVPNFPARYNVAPSFDVPAIRMGEGGGARALTLLRWGLVPSWAKEGMKPLINARGETVAEKPSFRSAFKRRRCLLPADGFYEWRRPQSGPKQPFNIQQKGGEPFAMAGIWEVFTDAEGSEVQSCAIITTSANKTLEPIHHRMPVILDPDDWAAWIETPEDGARDLLALLKPAPNDLLKAYEVSTRVNRVAHDGPDLIEPIAQEPQGKEDPSKKSESGQGSLF